MTSPKIKYDYTLAAVERPKVQEHPILMIIGPSGLINALIFVALPFERTLEKCYKILRDFAVDTDHHKRPPSTKSCATERRFKVNYLRRGCSSGKSWARPTEWLRGFAMSARGGTLRT